MTKSWTGLLVAALAGLPPVQGTEYWVLGTSQTEGWYDVNKTFSQDFPDSQLCWAASASNMLAWWQDHNPEYNDLAAMDTPKGAQDIFDTFKTAFYNKGGVQYNGILWFMVGTNIPNQKPLDPPLGGYYKEAIIQLSDERPTYSWFEDASELGDASFVSQYIKEALQEGFSLGLGIIGDTMQHAVTLWGIDFNEETQMIEKMYLTDSDDIFLTNGDVPTLFEASCRAVQKELETTEGGKEMLEVLGIASTRNGVTWYDDSVYLMGLTPIATIPNMVPEPGTATLGLLALAALCGRRRR